ncbi:SUF system NifU family Fe-S cluster assembly protein [bacterium]|nr:SUF system NifU family Fe-S cluster assembly protein [bacterium]
MNEELFYGEVLTSHALESQWQKQLSVVTGRQEGINASCGDDIIMEWQVENGRLVDAGFSGEGCVIARASSDICVGLLVGKSLAEIAEILQNFMAWVQTGHENLVSEFPEVKVLASSIANPVRAKCATLAWHTAEKLLRGQQQLFGEQEK